MCSTGQTIPVWDSTNDSLRSMRPGMQPLLLHGRDATAQPVVPSVASLGAAVKAHLSDVHCRVHPFTLQCLISTRAQA